jgi:hypothetical protein
MVANVARRTEEEPFKGCEVRSKLPLKFTAAILFFSRECAETLLQVTIFVYAKAILDDLSNASSDWQEGIQVCVESFLPIGPYTRAFHSNGVLRSGWRLDRSTHLLQMEFGMSELQLNACPQFTMHHHKVLTPAFAAARCSLKEEEPPCSPWRLDFLC